MIARHHQTQPGVSSPSAPESAPGGGPFRSAIAERHVRISIRVLGVCNRAASDWWWSANSTFAGRDSNGNSRFQVARVGLAAQREKPRTAADTQPGFLGGRAPRGFGFDGRSSLARRLGGFMFNSSSSQPSFLKQRPHAFTSRACTCMHVRRLDPGQSPETKPATSAHWANQPRRTKPPSTKRNQGRLNSRMTPPAFLRLVHQKRPLLKCGGASR